VGKADSGPPTAAWICTGRRRMGRPFTSRLRPTRLPSSHAREPGTTRFGEVWFDDWAALFGAAPAPAPAPAPKPTWESIPDLAFGQTNNHVVSLQHFLNAYNWVPALPLLPATGYYGPQTTSSCRSAAARWALSEETDAMSDRRRSRLFGLAVGVAKNYML
jgi:hypothetical protein